MVDMVVKVGITDREVEVAVSKRQIGRRDQGSQFT